MQTQLRPLYFAVPALLATVAFSDAASAQSVGGQVEVQGNVQIGAAVPPPPPVTYVQPQQVYVQQQQPQYYMAQRQMMPQRNMRPIPYEGGAIPVGMHVESRNLRGLAIAGGTIFLSTYLINLLVGAAIGAAPGGSNALLLAVPVLGAPILAAQCTGSYGCGSLAVLATFDALVQTTGIVMFAAGLAIQRQYLVYDAAISGRRQRDTMQWALMPTTLPGGAGLSFGLTGF